MRDVLLQSLRRFCASVVRTEPALYLVPFRAHGNRRGDVPVFVEQLFEGGKTPEKATTIAPLWSPALMGPHALAFEVDAVEHDFVAAPHAARELAFPRA